MRVSYRPGTYIEYPCLECGYKMRLKTNLNKLSISDVAVIECQDCKIQKE